MIDKATLPERTLATIRADVPFPFAIVNFAEGGEDFPPRMPVHRQHRR